MEISNMAKMARSDSIMSPEFRCSWLAIFARRKDNRTGKDKNFGVAMLIPKVDGSEIGELWRIVQETAAKQWPENYQENFWNNPIKDGDTMTFQSGVNAGKLKREIHPEFTGHWVVDTMSNDMPEAVNEVMTSYMTTQGTRDPAAGDFRSGEWAHADINVFAYANENCGVAVGLNCIQKVLANGRDDASLGTSRVRAADRFAAIPGANPMMAAAPVPTAAMQPQAMAAPAPMGQPMAAPVAPMVPPMAAPVPGAVAPLAPGQVPY